jgi:hypothetical protein
MRGNRASLNSNRVRLLDTEHDRLIDQMSGLERRPTTGRDKVTHAQGRHDDLAVAVIASLWIVRDKRSVAVNWSAIVANPKIHRIDRNHADIYKPGGLRRPIPVFFR